MRAAKRIQINVALESVDTLTWVKTRMYEACVLKMMKSRMSVLKSVI